MGRETLALCRSGSSRSEPCVCGGCLPRVPSLQCQLPPLASLPWQRTSSGSGAPRSVGRWPQVPVTHLTSRYLEGEQAGEARGPLHRGQGCALGSVS